jgi:sugar phosphate isomerase/epimerase
MKVSLAHSRKLLQPFRDLKGKFPFRLGTTSYIYPGEILPNVELLADILDEIQLLLFEGNSYSNIPAPETIRELKRLCAQSRLTLSIHLPLDAYPGHEDEIIRKRSVDMIRRIYDVGVALECGYFIFHYPNKNPGGANFANRQRWHSQLRKSTEELLSSGIPPKSLCVENLAYPFGWVVDLIDTFGLAKCIDIGHLRVNRFPLKPHLRRHLPQTRVIHLHGLKKGVDHHGLSRHDLRSIRLLLSEIKRINYCGSLILEVFRLDHLLESLETWKEEWAQWNPESF